MTAPKSTHDQLRGVLTFCLAQLAAGRSTHQAVASASRVARSWGPKHLEVLPLGRTVVVQHRSDEGEPTVMVGAVETLDGFDCEHMKRLKRLERDIRHNGVSADQAIEQTRTIARSSRPLWWTWGGGALLSFSVAMQVAFSWPAAMLAALLWVLASALGLLGDRLKLPRLFSAMMRAAVVVLVAVPVSLVGVIGAQEASVAVGAVIILLVPLEQIVSMLVDAIDGHAQAAVARGTSFAMGLLGLGIGVAIGVSIARLPLDLEQGVDQLPTLSVIGFLCFGALGALGNALSNAGGADLVVPAAVIGLFTATVYLVFTSVLDLGPIWSAGLAAALLGMVSALWAVRSDYSSTAFALLGLTGVLLPSLTLYQGIAAELDQPGGGGADFASVIGVVGALAVGTSLGFVVAERLILHRVHRHTAHTTQEP